MKKCWEIRETTCIDEWICPYCGHRNNPEIEFDLTMNPFYSTCDKCKRKVEVFGSVEYYARPYMEEPK